MRRYLCFGLFGVVLMAALACADPTANAESTGGWTDDGKVVSTKSDSAYVGIGTKTPSSPFSVFQDGVPMSDTTFAVAAFDPKNPNKGVWLGYDAYAVTGILGADSDGATASELAFWTHDGTAHAERARFTSKGNFGLGIAAPDEKFHVVGNLHVQGDYDCTLGTGSGGASCSSDMRLKDNVVEMEEALDKILSLRAVEFDWNTRSRTPGRKGMGLIAQEVQEVFPIIVSTDSEGYRKIDYAVLVAPLIGAVKEMNDRDVVEIKQLKKQNAQLIEDVEVLKQWACQKEPTIAFCPKAAEPELE